MLGTILYCLLMILLIIALIVAAVYIIKFISGLGKPKMSVAEEQKMIEKEYQHALSSQKATEAWAIRYSTNPCPYCGHYAVRSTKWEDKQLSIAFWGVASSTIGKTYKCEYCGKMW